MIEMNKFYFKRYVSCSIILIFLFLIFIPYSTSISISKEKLNLIENTSFDLPEPKDLNITLEEAICRRMSVREFTGVGITNEELSTILWHAYGSSDSGVRNIHSIADEYPIKIYVLARCGVWLYNPIDHNLIEHNSFDMTKIGQYDTATIKIGLVWDKNKCTNENYAGAEIGEICQNIYFSCNALNLGTVTTATDVNQLYLIGLPLNEKPKIIMPIGHPEISYQFTYDPIISDLPTIKNSTTTLTSAIINRNETVAWEEIDISLQEQTQVVWSSYGYSYLMDEVNDKRHKTVPSSHGTYPLIIYCINKTGIYNYQSDSHQLIEVKDGDYRGEIAGFSESFISNASLMIIPILNITNKNEINYWAWYYEAAASAYNILLECTAWNLSANIILNTDSEGLNSVLGLDNEIWLPMFIIPVGKQKSFENQPPNVLIIEPETGLYFFGKKILNLDRTWIIGPFYGEIIAEDDFCFKSVHFFVNDKAVKYSNEKLVDVRLPLKFILRKNHLSVKVYDYEGKSNVKSIDYFKLL